MWLRVVCPGEGASSRELRGERPGSDPRKWAEGLADPTQKAGLYGRVPTESGVMDTV